MADYHGPVQTAESEGLKYPDIPESAHEFATLLQFRKTYELIEFLAMQQIKVSQRMIQENAEQQTQAELQRAHQRITELEQTVVRAQQ